MTRLSTRIGKHPTWREADRTMTTMSGLPSSPDQRRGSMMNDDAAQIKHTADVVRLLGR